MQLCKEDFVLLYNYCKSKNIGFISTPFDLESIALLEEFNMDFWKLPSGKITNLPYLEKIADTGKRIIMSTGMCKMNDIKEALTVLETKGVTDITLLHCNTQYPTPYEDVNLKAIKTLKEETGKKVGYSDHTKGIEVAIAAVAIGAEVIEKHFTLDNSMEGPDHSASLEPEELKRMIEMIRNIENALGSSKKEPSNSEKANISVVRKSIVAKRKIKKGEMFSEENLTTKRPGNGISPMRWYEVIGQKAAKDFAEDELIEL